MDAKVKNRTDFFGGFFVVGAWESSEGTLPAPDQKRTGEGEEFETPVQAAKKDLKYQPERSDKQNGPDRSGAETFDFLDEELKSGVFTHEPVCTHFKRLRNPGR